MTALPVRFGLSGIQPRCEARVDGRFAQDTGLEFVEQRAVDLYEDGVFCRLEGPCFWVTDPRRHYRFHPAEGCSSWHHHFLRFSGPRVVEWEEQGLIPFAPQPVADGAAMGERLDRIIHLSREAGTPAQYRAVNLLEELLLDLASWRLMSRPPVPWLGELLEALWGHSSGGWDEAGFAARHGISQVTLRRNFRASLGVPLHAYLIRLRINDARRLLEETDLPVKAIAERLGYCDTYYFQQQFRRIVGVTPCRYRKCLPLNNRSKFSCR